MDKIIIVDFGSQYTQLIARRVRACQTYCEIIPYTKKINFDNTIKGVILAGSPSSVTNDKHPTVNVNELREKVPILGICYGAQLIVKQYDGEIIASQREFGKAQLNIEANKNCPLLTNIPQATTVWMSHGDSIKTLPPNFEMVGGTDDIPIAFFQHQSESQHPVFGLQFHPEVYHTTDGISIIKNFLTSVCNCSLNWNTSSYIETSIKEIQQTVGDQKVLMALSGGVDSSVAARLIQKAIGEKLNTVFVNNGLLRKNEFDEVLESYKDMSLNVVGIDATDAFYKALKGVTQPEQKRKIIGKLFIDTFDDHTKTLSDIQFLGQGTTYPDIIESISVHGSSVTIKSHHNVGGLPPNMKLNIIEPIKYLFKDEVRTLGKELGIPEHIIQRHPFPGPGIAIRIMGEVTPQKVHLAQAADAIFINKLREHNLYDKVWQAGVILLSEKTVGVMGDERSYENVVALRAVSSVDGMTADWSRLSHDFLAEVSASIINNVNGINRVVYDISSKPPATIEWE